MGSVQNFVDRTIGVDLQNGVNTSNASKLVSSAERLVNSMQSDLLSGYLYNAVVKLHNGMPLEGGGLNRNQLETIASVAQFARNNFDCSPAARAAIEGLEGAARRYADFVYTETEDRPWNNYRTNHDGVHADRVLKKSESTCWGNSAKPRHTLVRRGKEIYEVLTWMSENELQRVLGKFNGANTNGIYSLGAEKAQTRTWAGRSRDEYKVTLGSGAFGSARIARRVDDDLYMVIKKTHPQPGINPTPQPLKLIPGVNDGSKANIVTVHDSYKSESRRENARIGESESVYTLTDVGVIDTQSLISIFTLLNFTLNDAHAEQPKVSELRTLMLTGGGEGADEIILNTIERLARLQSNPVSNTDVARRFRNTMALQMLKAVQQMHDQDMAHNDIKPDNFVLAPSTDRNNGQTVLKVKLIDFDLSASVRENVGKPRDIYCRLFAAGQASSKKRNNQPDKNDSYSMGVTLKALNGEPISSLLELRAKMKQGIKAVEDQTKIENRWKVLPELATLSDLSDLMCHPHVAKRYSVSKAINSLLFRNPDNVMNDAEFSTVASKLIRQAEMIPKQILNQLSPNEQIKRLSDPRLANTPGLAEEIGEQIKGQDTKYLLQKYVHENNTYGNGQEGAQKLLAALKHAEAGAIDDVVNAIPRRMARALYPTNWFKSKANQEADYKPQNRLA